MLGIFRPFCAALLLAGAARAEPLSIEQLFAAPQRSAPVLSPDGTHYAAVFSEGTVDRLVVAPVAGGEVRELARFEDMQERVYWASWPKPGRLLVGTHERDRSVGIGVRPRRTSLYSIAVADGAQREYLRRGFQCQRRLVPRSAFPGSETVRPPDCLTTRLPYQDEVIHALPAHATDVLVVYRQPYPSVRRLNLETGDTKLVESAIGERDGFVADASGAVRFATTTGRTEIRLSARASADDRWRTVAKYATDDPESVIRFAGFASDPGTIFVVAQHEGRRALFSLEIATARRELVAARADANVIGVQWARGGGALGAALFDDDVRRFIDPASEREQARVDALIPGAYNEISEQSWLGGAAAIVISRGQNGLHRYYALDRTRGVATRLHAEHDLPEADLARALVVPRSPGFAFRAAITRPTGSRAPSAAVILVRAGQHAADTLGFDPEVQALASRGIAVLELDLGAAALPDAHVGEWRDALAAAVGGAAAWLEAEGIAAPGRVGVHGSGLGGYAALLAAAREPDRFAALSTLSAVTSLREMTTESRNFEARDWPEWLLDRGEQGKAIASKDAFAKALRAPVLLGHARDAVAAHVSHSRSLAKALARAKREVEYLELDSDTDALALPENRVRFYTAWAAHFERELAGQPRVADGPH